MNSEPALVCNMDVFTPVQRENHTHITTQLIHVLQGIQEVENGYEFMFPNEADVLLRIAEFITNERLCCPFLEFTLHVLSSREPISLSLTGPIGTREFLQAEFEEAFR